MKKLMIFVLMPFVSCALFAQNNSQDTIYFKNGVAMTGSVIELTLDKIVRIQAPDGSVCVYRMDEINKITKVPVCEQKRRNDQGNSGIKKGYYGVIEYGTGFSYGLFYNMGMSRINTISGYRINPYFAAGAGTGLRFHPEEGLFMPVFADLRMNFLDKRTSPYFSLDAGYSFNIYDLSRGGIMLNPVFGLSVKIHKRIAFNLGLSYELMGVAYRESEFYEYSYYYMPVDEEIITGYTHNMCFQFGVSF